MYCGDELDLKRQYDTGGSESQQVLATVCNFVISDENKIQFNILLLLY